MKVQQLPGLSQIIGINESSMTEKRDRWKGWREWYGAIAALQELVTPIKKGLILSSPALMVDFSQINPNLTTVAFTPGYSHQNGNTLSGLTLTPGDHSSAQVKEISLPSNNSHEQFCLLFTPEFSLLMVLTVTEEGNSYFDFSFDPEATQKAWLTLRSRLQNHYPEKLVTIEQQREQFPICSPDYRTVTQFSRQLLNYLPSNEDLRQETSDIELLQALTHEVRTPLTTIRMLTRLLLKRKDLEPEVLKRLRVIDQECTEQINRMELIFQATELEGKQKSESSVNLTSIPLKDLFTQSIPYWKKQAKRRNVDLEVLLPEKLPTVITNPELLTQVLTGLMENFTGRISSNGKLQVHVRTAGNQIKLQLLSQNLQESFRSKKQERSIGQLLTLQPETGNLSLNLDVTKNLFQALGGKLTVRQRAEAGEVLTVFLPVSIINH